MITQRNIRWTRLFASLLLSVLAVTKTTAQPTLDTLVGQSDLVFQGVVEGIDYSMSNPGGPEGTSVPYTYVTYRVTKVFRGAAEDMITLRFIGGLDEQNGLYMQASNAPQFDLGDEDILFVQGNTERLVPLVDDEEGRFRVIGGQVYDENAHSLNIADDGSLILGARYLKSEAATTMVKGRMMIRDLGPRAVDGASDAMLVADLLPQLQQSATLVPAPEFKFVSADIQQPIDAPDMTPSTSPAVDAEAPVPASSEEVEVQPAVPVQRKN
jgi:hypothetical protein